MTAQIPDVLMHQGQRYVLAGIGGLGLFDPSEHGLRVGAMSTACWRGYVCEYTVEDDQPFLTALLMGASKPPRELFGAKVRHDDGTATYRPIRVR